jgi:hypothetical protein
LAKGFVSTGFTLNDAVFVTGKHAYLVGRDLAGGGEMKVFQLNHLETPTIQTGNLQTGNLDVTDNAVVNNDLDVRGGLNVGPNGAQIDEACCLI